MSGVGAGSPPADSSLIAAPGGPAAPGKAELKVESKGDSKAGEGESSAATEPAVEQSAASEPAAKSPVAEGKRSRVPADFKGATVRAADECSLRCLSDSQ